MSDILCKRVYEQPNVTDGFRVLVDRLWPRGMKKETADIDLWAKDTKHNNAVSLKDWLEKDFGA